MVDQIIRPADLPNRASPNASEKIPVDNGSNVGGATVESIVLSGRPTASQAEAEAGVNAVKAMTPLTTAQAIDARAVTNITAGSNVEITGTPKNPIISATAELAPGDKGDVSVITPTTVWRLNRNYKTVSDLLADDGSGPIGMGYAGSGASVTVSAGQEVCAQGFRYEVAASGATDNDTVTAGGVKLYLREKDKVLFAPAIGAGGGLSNDAPKIQKILDRQGEVVFPRDDYLITESINIPTGTGVTWAEGSRLVAGANNLTMITSTPASYFSQIRNLHIFGNGYGTVTGLDLVNFRLASGIFNLQMESVYYGLIMRGGLFGTLIQNPTSYPDVPFPIRIIDNAATAKIENPNFDATGNVNLDGQHYGAGISIEKNVGEGFFGNVNVLIDGGYIQGFGYGIYDQAYGTIIENTYFEAIENADIFADGAINPRYRGTQHWANPDGGTHSKRGIMARNTDGMIIDGPVMGSGGRSIGMLDVDSSNLNCLLINSGSSIGMNTPLGDISGIAQILSPQGLSSLNNMAVRHGTVSALAPSTPSNLLDMAAVAGVRGKYEVVAYSPFTGSAAAFGATATIIWDGSTAKLSADDGTNLAITTSSSMITITHTGGAPLDFEWVITFTPATA